MSWEKVELLNLVWSWYEGIWSVFFAAGLLIVFITIIIISIQAWRGRPIYDGLLHVTAAVFVTLIMTSYTITTSTTNLIDSIFQSAWTVVTSRDPSQYSYMFNTISSSEETARAARELLQYNKDIRDRISKLANQTALFIDENTPEEVRKTIGEVGEEAEYNQLISDFQAKWAEILKGETYKQRTGLPPAGVSVYTPTVKDTEKILSTTIYKKARITGLKKARGSGWTRGEGSAWGSTFEQQLNREYEKQNTGIWGWFRGKISDMFAGIVEEIIINPGLWIAGLLAYVFVQAAQMIVMPLVIVLKGLVIISLPFALSWAWISRLGLAVVPIKLWIQLDAVYLIFAAADRFSKEIYSTYGSIPLVTNAAAGQTSWVTANLVSAAIIMGAVPISLWFIGGGLLQGVSMATQVGGGPLGKFLK